MADAQPPNVVEGATTGDIDDEIPVAAKSAEDRKAAAALSSMDAPRDDDASATKDVDREAVRKAMDRLAGSGIANGAATKKGEDKQSPKKIVKVDQADVTLLVCLASYCFLQHRAVPGLQFPTLECKPQKSIPAPSPQNSANEMTFSFK